MTYDFDLICIGGGSGGIASARRASEYGAKVAVIEKARLGGTCVNVGCVPKKLFWYTAQTAEALLNAEKQGFNKFTPPLFNWEQFKTQRDAYIARLNGIYENNLNKANITHIQGSAYFIDKHTVAVDDKTYSAAHIIIATGGTPSVPEIEGKEYGITSDDFFALQKQPKTLAIVGGGYIACEIAQVMQALGTNVHIIARASQLLRHLDNDISLTLQNTMQSQGINIHLESQVEKIEKVENQLKIKLKNGKTLQSDCLIWATGRNPATSALKLENAGVKVDDKQKILVDEYQNTNIQGIYAIGDVIDKIDLTPVAIAAGRKLVARLFNNEKDAKLNYDNIPSIIFTHPPIGTIGLSEKEAKEKYGTQIKVYRAEFNPMARSFAVHPAKTIFKLICLGEEERIIGLHAIGDGVDEMLQGFAVAIIMGACKKDFDNCVAIHPTSSEEFVTMR